MKKRCTACNKQVQKRVFVRIVRNDKKRDFSGKPRSRRRKSIIVRHYGMFFPASLKAFF